MKNSRTGQRHNVSDDDHCPLIVSGVSQPAACAFRGRDSAVCSAA
jgi:hypothetical protein